MDHKRAFQMTLDLITKSRYHTNPRIRMPKECSYQHLVEMQERLISEEFGEDKAGRYLGWAQACAVMISGGRITLEEMKEINRLCGAQRSTIEHPQEQEDAK